MGHQQDMIVKALRREYRRGHDDGWNDRHYLIENILHGKKKITGRHG